MNFCDIWLRQRVVVARLESSADNRSSAVGTQPFTVSSCATDNRSTQPTHPFSIERLKKFDIALSGIKKLPYEDI